MERQVKRGKKKTGVNTEELSLSGETTARRDGRLWRGKQVEATVGRKEGTQRKELEERERKDIRKRFEKEGREEGRKVDRQICRKKWCKR